MTETSTLPPVEAEVPVVASVEEKKRKKHSRMPDTRKADHHTAKDLLEAYFAANPAVKDAWTGLFPGKQTRVLSNLLLDYVPNFISAFQAGATPEFLAQCDALLRAATDVTAYRKANRSFFQKSRDGS